MTRFTLAILFVAACERPESVPPQPIDAPPVPVLDGTPKPDCRLWELESELMRSRSGMHGSSHLEKALELWTTTQPSCRTGRWHLAASRLLDLLPRYPLAVDSIRFETAEAALIAALGQPDDIDVLTRVAEVSVFNSHVALPPNACDRARVASDGRWAIEGLARREWADSYRTDPVHYVCARAALAAGRVNEASDELAAIVAPNYYADFDLARAQAAALQGDHVAAKRYAAKAIAVIKEYDDRTEPDRVAIVRLAKQIR